MVVKVLILALVWPSWLLSVSAGKIVKSLPGFNGPLPFELETGYITVDEEQEANLFYYFFKSERNPAEDPVLYFIEGGPGCSAMNGIGLGNGPIGFVSERYGRGSLPRLLYRKETWTKVSSIIYVDWPGNTGFSYTKAKPEYEWSDTKSAEYLYTFILKWFSDHPEFLPNPFYVVGQSYGGKMAPIVTHEIINGLDAGVQPVLNLKGYIGGNPVVLDARYEGTLVDYAHGMGFISQELYEAAQENCGRNFLSRNNLGCKRSLDAVNKNLEGISSSCTLTKECGLDSPNPRRLAGPHESLIALKTDSAYYQPWQKRCKDYVFILFKLWANNPEVQEALGVSEEWSGEWLRCNRQMKNNFDHDLGSAVPYYFNITARGYRGLVFSGDHDIVANFMETQAWIKSFKFFIVDDWRRWLVDGQNAGYTRTYGPGLTFATVKGAGHTAYFYKPKECLMMFERWICGKKL